MTGTVPASPRTDAEPMAFTMREFARGALYAWLWFLLLSTIAHLPIAGVYVFIVLVYTVPWSIGALLIGSIPAYWLGRGLRGSPKLSLHGGMFTLFGAIVGTVTTGVLFSAPWSGYGFPADSMFSITVVCLAATASVPLGWWQTVRRALRNDRTNESWVLNGEVETPDTNLPNRLNRS